MKKTVTFLWFLAVVGAGCANGTTQIQPSAEEEPMHYRRHDGAMVDCRLERPLGSNIAERVCRTYVPRGAADQKALDDVMLKRLEGTPKAGSGGN